ncbi:metallophosphoesterase [Opitutus sp. GAS368]|uniref:metallophosphoesterase family protein n=1 Tax=Opitutus sp. GAS368 TaxID=1882749 RepID=UPI000879FFA7|nr:metallophosphoesterase [Opitutus sp. GAS368]SDR73727.1 Cytolysin, a secreted calcineurin-like phosphatase [Opitutus sp. GAS368]
MSLPFQPLPPRPVRRVRTALWASALAVTGWTAAVAAPVTFVFTSDVHFGINRGNFRGAANVESRVVNAAMLEAINAVPAAVLPADGGLNAGRPVGPVDFVVITGDLVNRQELYPIHIQSAAVSWGQFAACYVDGLALHDATGRPTPLLLVPGNHDVSNAIGSPSKLVPARDATSLIGIYNRMMRPALPRTTATYAYPADRIQYSRDFGGVHCVFLSIWPDRAARAWMESDLQAVPAGEPVFIFCHDPPEGDARHFTNPNGAHDINDRDKFENVIADVYADGVVASVGGKPDGPTTIEQRAFAAFLKAHPNITGYFHGHSNWTEFYTWPGPDGDLSLSVFRSDSPMKGKVSGKDETKLAFQVVVFDAAQRKLTARECLWNTSAAAGPLAWGQTRTVSLAAP